jgi:hypothetical protein
VIEIANIQPAARLRARVEIQLIGTQHGVALGDGGLAQLGDTHANSMASIVKKVYVVFFFCRAVLLEIKLIESPFTNDLRQFQEIAGGAPLAVVAVAINYISPDLGSLCH